MAKQKRYTATESFAYRHMAHKQNITTYNKISKIRSVNGIACIGIGLITTPVPMTTIPLIMLGSYLLGYDGKIILGYLNHKRKELYNWFYANRTPKKLIRTVKMRLFML